MNQDIFQYKNLYQIKIGKLLYDPETQIVTTKSNDYSLRIQHSIYINKYYR